MDNNQEQSVCELIRFRKRTQDTEKALAEMTEAVKKAIRDLEIALGGKK